MPCSSPRPSPLPAVSRFYGEHERVDIARIAPVERGAADLLPLQPTSLCLVGHKGRGPYTSASAGNFSPQVTAVLKRTGRADTRTRYVGAARPVAGRGPAAAASARSCSWSM